MISPLAPPLRAAVWILALGLPAASPATLPGTSPWTAEGDLAAQMVDGIHRFLLRETADAAGKRSQFWRRNFASAAAYERSVAPNRERLRKIIGAVDPRLEPRALSFDTATATSVALGRGKGYQVHAVRWPVFSEVTAEGLLLQPDGPPAARVVVIPDADWSPEMVAGLVSGLDVGAQLARRLAESGCQVIVPVILDRKDTWSGIPGIQMTNQPHREWIYRMAWEAGRHIIGYEVQKVLAAVDWFALENTARAVPIAVAGYGEGGLLALHSSALDTRIRATLVSGYFQPRDELWKEPIYRDVWGFVREFGDAELAGLIAPRALIIEAARGPEIPGPPPETKERRGAAPNGRLTTPSLQSVRTEVERARPFFQGLDAGASLHLATSGEEALNALAHSLGIQARLKEPGIPPQDLGQGVDSEQRMERQFRQLVAHTQALLAEAPRKRAKFWSRADASSPERWQSTTGFYRDYIRDEVIGRLPPPSLPVNARTRLVYDEPKFTGYEVMLDVWPDVFAYGILLLPKDIQPGERRPVVVCQHGLEGRPTDVADPKIDSPAYHRFAARLAEEGFITFAPQNPYIGGDRFRMIQRKGHPLKLALFSFILGQHQRLLEWLSSLSFVDSARIGFYGLSYGGKTAVRVPPLLAGYALSICSADFNEWVWKTTSVESRYSYLLTGEYDMIEFDFANVVNYAELAMLMAPRPFMVERGHLDGVAPDEWVAYEYARVRHFYTTRMHAPGKTEIEFFDGPHTINGKGAFEFLRKHLQWPRRGGLQ